MKVFILVVLATVCIVGLSKAAPYHLKEDVDQRALLQALLSSMVKEADAKQENTQLEQREEDNAEEEWCVCVTSPCPCARPGQRGNDFDYDMDLNEKQQEQQKKALVQEDFEPFEMKQREQAEEENHFGYGMDLNEKQQEQQKNALVQEEFLSAIAEYLMQQKMN